MSGPNDTLMAEPSNPISNGINWVVNHGMDMLGYDTRRRAPDQDNSFYREHAQDMPGWSMPGTGIPSGAYAQDRATNYVGHPTADRDSTQTWQNVRASLVQQEGAAIDTNRERTGSGKLSFGQVYDAHVNAYNSSNKGADGNVNSSQGGHNGFIDPASFALAVYGAPMLEAAHINSGPITGTSIDMFNDPTDSATAGWAKRMALSGGEMGAGALAMASGHPLIGAGLMGLGAFSGAWNTATALKHGMLGEIGGGIANGARSLVGGASNMLSSAGRGIANGAQSLVGGAGNMLSSAGGGIANGARSLVGGAGNVLSNAGGAISSGVGAVGHGLSNAASSAGGAISHGWRKLFG